MTDDQLVEQVRACDTAAFGELVERHRGAVFRAALAALGNEADAEDIAQEALVLAFRRIDQFRGDASVRTWMVSIAWRLSLSRRRRTWWKVNRTAVEEPELHLHPSAHALVADLFLQAATSDGSRVRFLVETHSETFLLRLRRRIAGRRYASATLQRRPRRWVTCAGPTPSGSVSLARTATVTGVSSFVEAESSTASGGALVSTPVAKERGP